MRKIVIAGDQCSSIEELHEYLQELFGFPSYYGKNLDALYDCLTEVEEPLKIELSQSIAEEENLGEYGDRVLEVFETAAEDNPQLCLHLTR